MPRKVAMLRFVPIFGNQAIALLTGMIGLKICSTLIPPELFGRYSLFLTIAQIGYLVTHAGLINHATRYWQRSEGERDDYLGFLITTWRQGVVHLTPFLALISIALYFYWNEKAWLWIFPVFVLGNASFSLTMIFLGILNASERHWATLFLNSFANATRMFLPLGMVLVLHTSLLAMTLGYALHSVLVTLCVLWLFPKSQRGVNSADKRANWTKELRIYGKPFLLIGLSGWLMVNADRWIIALLFGEERAGIFAIASGLGAVIPGFVTGGLMQFAFPRIFRSADNAKTLDDWLGLAARCDKLTLYLLVLSIAGLVLLHYSGPFLIGTLIGEKYTAAIGLILPTGCGALAVQINQFQYLLLQSQYNSAAIVRIMGLVAVIRTTGGLFTAMISWKLFLIWLVASCFISLVVGRYMIRKIALVKYGSHFIGP